MSQHSRNTNWIPIAAIAVAALGAYVVWQFSTTFGLDMSTGASVFGRLIALAITAGICWKFGDDFPLLHLENTWPVFLGLLWVCWWPALNFWATKDYPSFYQPDDAIVWWSAWYTKLAGLLVFTGGGFGLRAALQRDY